jgi:hypothetical protein
MKLFSIIGRRYFSSESLRARVTTNNIVDLPNETNSAVIQGQVTQASGGDEHVQTILEKLLVNAVLLPIVVKEN